MKNKILTAFIFLSFFFINTNIVYAAGSAAVGFSGNGSTPVNKNFTVKLTVSNISGTNGGIVSLGGNLSFDPSIIQYVSGTGATSPYSFQINTDANYKIAGLDTSLNNGMKSNTNVFTFTFKPLKTGSATISFKNGKLTDTSGEVTTSYQAKVINITEPLNDDTSLSSLKVDGFDINFNSKNTNYNLTVPYNVNKLNITAIANNSKSSVKINGASNLIAEETTNVEIIVTSQSGSTQKYIIRTTREKDPNKPLDSNNNLTEINPSVGLLSPHFSKDVTNYIIYVPFEVETIDFNAKVENEKYSKLSVVGDKNLIAGSANEFKLIVTAEDNSSKTYTIIVKRANEYSTNHSSNVFLKSVTIKNGSAINFDKNINSYRITKEDGFELSYEVEDQSSVVHKVEDENNIYLIVESSNGNFNVYQFELSKTNSLLIIIIIETVSMIGLIIMNVFGIKILKRKKRK